MRLELWLLLGTAAILANIYTEGRALKYLLSHKKYFQMGGVVLGALLVYWVMRKNPVHAQQIISNSNEYLKYLPIDKNTSSVLSPILDFTSKYGGRGGDMSASPVQRPILDMSQGGRTGIQDYAERRLLTSGGKSTKRSVSETKKKWVAAKQNWKCGSCHKQLPPWFEVDHKIRLEHGGSNHVDNLVALCRDCHGEKTAIENL